jgi:multisubunit Na+/H+ antiporter MnhC subunit
VSGLPASELEVLGLAFYAGALGLVLIGVYAVVAGRNLIRVLLALGLIDSGVNLFLVATGFRADAAAPILLGGQPVGPMVDPLPQALILTSIVIGVGVLALGLALAVRVRETLGTLDLGEMAARVAAPEVRDAGEAPGLPAHAGETHR